MMTKNKLFSVCLFAGLLVLLSACGKQSSDTQTTTGADAPAAADKMDAHSIADNKMGLSKTSVFDTPEPQTVNYNDKFPGQNSLLPRAYPGAPSHIPHNIDAFKPITASNNACIGCHNNPSMHGKEIPKGMATPMPESHYRDTRHKPDLVAEQIVEGRYVCTQCHVPQANVDTLVENTFKEGQ